MTDSPGAEGQASAPREGGRRIGLVAVAIMGVHLLARFGGMIQKMVLARFFGTSFMADAATGMEKVFQAIYYIPEEMLTHSLLPVFTRVRQEEGEAAAWRVASLAGTIQALLLVVVTIFAVAKTTWLVGVIVGVPDPTHEHYLKELRNFEQIVPLVRVAMLGLFCTSLGSLTYVILNADKRFVTPALGDVAQKLGIIVGTVIVCVGFRSLGPMGYAIGFIIGGVFKLLTHFIALGPKLKLARPGFDFRHPALRELGRLMLPLLAGSLIGKGRDLLETRIAWAVAHNIEGTLSSLDFARKIVWMPVNTLPYALGIALFPFLADWALRGEKDQVTRAFLTASRMMIFIFLPMTVASLVLGEQIITVLYKGGKFDQHSVELTTAAFRVYSLGMVFYALEIISLQVYYAHRDTKTPFWQGLAASVIQIAVAYTGGVLLGWGNAGIAMGFALAKTLKVGLMWYQLRPRLTGFEWPSLLGLIAKSAIASVVMAAWLLLSRHLVQHHLNLHGAKGAALYLVGTSAVGAALYVGIAAALRIEELTTLLAQIRRKLRR